MKKILVRAATALAILILLGFLAAGLFMDSVVKRGIETFGPKLAKVDVKLQSVSISMLSGGGRIEGLVVGNPEGFKTASAIKVGSASLSVSPGSLLSDKIAIKSIHIQGPEITFETSLKGNNLSKIRANLEDTAGAGKSVGGGGNAAPADAKAKESKPARKLQVNDFVLSGAKVHLGVTALGGSAMTIPIPDIHMTDLGTGPEGMTPAELVGEVLGAIEKEAAQAAASSVTDVGKGALQLGGGLGASATNAASKITKGLGGLFQKK